MKIIINIVACYYLVCNCEKLNEFKLVPTTTAKMSSTEQSSKRKDNSNDEISWKEWKKRRMEEHEKWKNLRQEKKLKKLLEEAATDKNVENQNTSDSAIANDLVPTEGRKYTVSIAVPGSIMDNAQSTELKTYLAGQIARAAAVFNVDEIVVFDEYALTKPDEDLDDDALKMGKKLQGCRQMVRILQFLECPQYLRRYFFPLHKDLEYAGLLNPLDIPHHLRVSDESKYREGVVLEKPTREGKGSFVYIGLKKTAVIDKCLTSNIRVTVELDDHQPSKKHFKGKAVSPSMPCRKDGIYWGYSVRFARSFSAIFSECPYKEGYDVVIGTSDKGSNISKLKLTPFRHLLIVFGGLKGLEACIEADEAFEVNDPTSVFHHYLNACPNQGSRTIRTEEAVLITLSAIKCKISRSQRNLISQD